MSDTGNSGGTTLIYLEQAERLSFDQQRVPDGQLLTGNVRFRHDDALMYCDSAYFFQATNSFRAFSNVRIVQGDTIFLYGNRLDYDGNTMLAKMRDSVRMENRTTTLTTDTLYYDRVANQAYYHTGGTIADDLNSLTSERGEYHPGTHQAIFKTNVKLSNQNFVMNADTLHYNTQSHIADIVGQTEIIYQGETTIRSTLGWYNTENELSALYNQSVVEHNEGQTLTGDTIYYDKRKQYGRVFGHMMLTDSTNHMTLCGNYGTYDQINGKGMATDSAMAVDWSSPDTLYMHADSMFIGRYSVQKTIEQKEGKQDNTNKGKIKEPDSKSETDVKDSKTSGTADTKGSDNIGQSENSKVAKVKDKDHKKKKDRKNKKRHKNTETTANDTTAALDIDISISADSVITLKADTSSKGIEPVVSSITTPQDSTGAVAPGSISTTLADSIVATAEDSISYNTLRAFWNVRLYRIDLQAICDSMYYDSKDSIMHLYREPVLWNENNQITGDNADIYMANGTIDRAVITGKGIVMQRLDSLHYNQMQGKELVAYVNNRQLTRVDVNGNAETVFYPEEDEELIGVNKTQSSYVKIYFENQKIKRAVLTTTSEGTMYPLDQIDNEELFLSQFFWAEQERPKSRMDIFSKTIRTPKNQKKVVSAVNNDDDDVEPEEKDNDKKKDKSRNKRTR